MSGRRALWDALFAGGGGAQLPGYLECVAASLSTVALPHDARANSSPLTVCGWLLPASWPADGTYAVVVGEENVGVSSSWSCRLGSQTRGDEMSLGAYSALAETPFGNSYRVEFGRYSCPPVGVRGSGDWVFVAATWSAANGWRWYVQNNRGLGTTTGVPPAALLDSASGVRFASALVAGVAGVFGDCDFHDWRAYAAELVEADLADIALGISALVPTQRWRWERNFAQSVAPVASGVPSGGARIARSPLVPTAQPTIVWCPIGTSLTVGQLGAPDNGTLFQGGFRTEAAKALRGRALLRSVGATVLSGGFMPTSDGVLAALASTLFPQAMAAGARNPQCITLEGFINNARGSLVTMAQTRADVYTLAANVEAGLAPGQNPYTCWVPDAPYLFAAGATRYDKQYAGGLYEALRNRIGPAVAALYPARKYSTMLDTDYVPGDIGPDGVHYTPACYQRLGVRLSDHLYTETAQPPSPADTARDTLRTSLGADLYFLLDTTWQPTEIAGKVSAYADTHIDNAGTGGATIAQGTASRRPEWTGYALYLPFGITTFDYEFLTCNGGAIPSGALGMSAQFQLNHDVQAETYHGGCIASPATNGGASKAILYLRTLDGGVTYFWAFSDDTTVAAFALPTFAWVPDLLPHTIEAGFLGGSRTNAANYFVRIDGVDLVATGTTAGGGAAAGNGAIGCFYDGVTRYFVWNGWVAKVAAFNPGMSASEYAALRAWTACAWWQ